MTLDVGPFLESVAPISILVASAFGIARVLYKQDEAMKKLDKLVTKVDNLDGKHAALERKVYDDDMYERGLADAVARRRVMGGPSKKPRSRR
jgi:hypothetical protein